MRVALLLLFSLSTLHATEYLPWFSPPWEFQARSSFAYGQGDKITTPNGNFALSDRDYTFQASLGITPWPYWNVEAELYLTYTTDIPFSYEAAYGTVRYQWFDDVSGDPFTFVTGATLSFPGERYQKDFSFIYHAEVNAELHATIGKEWSRGSEWYMRGWALAGWGIANQGNGWLHALAVWEFQPSCFKWGAFTEAYFGLGPNNIIEEEPFEGYKSIGYRIIDVGAFLDYQIGCLGTITGLGWYNAYARNFFLHGWGCAISLLIPFSL